MTDAELRQAILETEWAIAQAAVELERNRAGIFSSGFRKAVSRREAIEEAARCWGLPVKDWINAPVRITPERRQGECPAKGVPLHKL